MTDSNYTAIALVMDRSGSMTRIRDDAEGAIETFLADQRKLPGKASFTFVRFDDRPELVHMLVPLDSVDKIRLEPRYSTALYDAIGYTIAQLGEKLAAIPEDERPGKVLFAIMTDGLENASSEWTRSMVFEAISRQRSEYQWDFVYLGANQDAMAEGARIGVPADSALTFAATPEGTRAGGQSLSAYAGSYRSTGVGDFNAKKEDDPDKSA
jgi:hypothetical protein